MQVCKYKHIHKKTHSQTYTKHNTHSTEVTNEVMFPGEQTTDDNFYNPKGCGNHQQIHHC